MTWNYRIIRHKDYFGLHEVYYDKNGQPNGWTLEQVTFACDLDEGADGVRHSLAMALADAVRRTVLVVDETGTRLIEDPNE